MKKLGVVLLILISCVSAMAAEFGSKKVLRLTADDMPLIVGDGSENLLDIEIRNFFPIQQAFGLDETVVDITENTADCRMIEDFILQTWDDNKVLKVVVLTYSGLVSVNSNGQDTGGCRITIKTKKTSEILHTVEYKFYKK